jgi:coenzyme F420-reducing hydrogenase alpha subunit
MNDYITKIEGHGNLKIDFRKNKAELHIEEGERLFEGILIGRNYKDAPFIVSRICGICPVAHYLASILAIEKAFGVVNNETTINLRKLLLCAQIIQSHNLHLFFLALPDYLNLNSSLELIEKNPAEFHLSLNIKRTMDEVAQIIGGRLVHPVNPIIGGFAKLPTKKQLAKIKNNLEETIDEVEDVVKLFTNLDYPKFSC